MHKYLATIATLLVAAAAWAAPKDGAYPEVNAFPEDVTSDMALIYAGSDRRPNWTVDEIMPYVVHTYTDGHKDWFFDAFLFLEFTGGSRGIGFGNGEHGGLATKEDWLWLLDQQFADGKILAALDSAISIGKATLGEPRLRHKVVMGVPAPQRAQRNWGEINGKNLDFNSEDDRIAASKWYVDRLIERWEKAGFKNIDLTGTYWQEEALFTNGPIMPAVNDWVYRRGLRSYWIPYYKDNEEHKFNWKKYGFDVAYQQPNYFFERDIPLQRLYDAVAESKKYGLALEMEFESQGTSRVQHDDPDSFYERLSDYLDVFETTGVFDQSPVAWYSGTQGYKHLAESKDPHNHLIADRMADIVARRQAAKAASLQWPKNSINDLALIYQGAERRIDWTPEQFEPYVAHKFADGHQDWLFDGFLFLDADIDGDIKFFPWAGFEGANKGHWQWYMDRVFEKGKSLDALDKCIGKLKKKIGDPGFKHKIILTQLIPVPGNKHWGEIDGHALDFDKTEDQVKAMQWYIDQMVARFNKAGYKNLELQGIYWLDEDMCHTGELPKYIAPYIHKLGLEFSWIPYFKARGYEKHKKLGFDITYQQPGHFFEWSKPDKRLDEAIDISRLNGMAMEFECDSEALSQAKDCKQKRMAAYIDAFERHGVWDACPVAYYTGSKAFIDMANNPSPENQAIMDRLANIIVKRRATMPK